jgi:tRNA(Ile)-lysidine synthase
MLLRRVSYFNMGDYACVLRVAALLKEYDAAGEAGLLVGISGGPDSVALLHMLHCLERAGVVGRLYAAHMHHGIRGESADEDAAFVRALCCEWGIPLFEERADAVSLSEQEGLTLEEAARNARYAFLRRAKGECGAQYIVTAHHRDDQAETVLLHLLRGAGLAGLCGMQVRAGDILRPLLTTSREELLAYLKEEGLVYRTDESNLEPGCMRNRIRLELLPLLRREYNPAVADSLCRMAELLFEDESLLRAQAEQALDAARLPQGGYACDALLRLPMALQSRAVRIALEREGALYDMQRGGIQSVCALLRARTGARMELPRSLQARISYGMFIIEPVITGQSDFETQFLWPGDTLTPQGRFVARFADSLRKDENARVAYFDADKLPPDASVRRRIPGDRFHPLGAPGIRKLKDYLIDKKIPRPKRDVPLIASGRNVLFFPGGTVSQTICVRDGTQRILRVEYLED